MYNNFYVIGFGIITEPKNVYKDKFFLKVHLGIILCMLKEFERRTLRGELNQIRPAIGAGIQLCNNMFNFNAPEIMPPSASIWSKSATTKQQTTRSSFQSARGKFI
jgi:hypothetical protein